MNKTLFALRLWAAENGGLATTFVLAILVICALVFIKFPLTAKPIDCVVHANTYMNKYTGNQYEASVKTPANELVQVKLPEQKVVTVGATVCVLQQESFVGKISYRFVKVGKCK